MGVALEERPLADIRQRRLARHDPDLLAQAAMQLVEEHTVRVVKNGAPVMCGSAEKTLNCYVICIAS